MFDESRRNPFEIMPSFEQNLKKAADVIEQSGNGWVEIPESSGLTLVKIEKDSHNLRPILVREINGKKYLVCEQPPKE